MDRCFNTSVLWLGSFSCQDMAVCFTTRTTISVFGYLDSPLVMLSKLFAQYNHVPYFFVFVANVVNGSETESVQFNRIPITQYPVEIVAAQDTRCERITPHQLYTCSTCSKVFRYKTDYKRHLISHSNDRPYPCTRCGKAFKFKFDLIQHNLTHTEKLYSCPTCCKAFSGEHILDIHLRTHAGEAPYKCTSCTNVYRGIQGPFKCTTCGKLFLTEHVLSLHSRVHIGESLNKCITCHGTFRTCRDLNVHLRIHTGTKPYSCTTSGETFSLSRQLKRHLATRNAESP